MSGKTERKIRVAAGVDEQTFAGGALSSRLINSLMLILIGAALGLFWNDAVHAAAIAIDRLT